MHDNFQDSSHDYMFNFPNEGADIPIFIDPELLILSKPDIETLNTMKGNVISELGQLIPSDLNNNLSLLDKLIDLMNDFKIEYLLDFSFEKQLLKRYFNRKDFKLKKEKEDLFQAEVLLKTSIVSLMSKINYFKEFDYKTIDELITNYPEFNGLNTSELEYLLRFRNTMTTALRFIPARLNKKLLLDLSSKLEGSSNVYITGGQQLPATTRRVTIYEKEGNVSPKRRIRNETK
jgi:hypothetical protein